MKCHALAPSLWRVTTGDARPGVRNPVFAVLGGVHGNELVRFFGPPAAAAAANNAEPARRASR